MDPEIETNRILQLAGAPVGPAPDLLLGEHREPALDLIDPGAVGGGVVDMEAGMAKLFASEAAMEITLNAVRIHGGYGYSTEFDVERYFRDAPLMIVGEGTNEIQRGVITGQLISRGGLPR